MAGLISIALNIRERNCLFLLINIGKKGLALKALMEKVITFILMGIIFSELFFGRVSLINFNVWIITVVWDILIDL